MLSSVEMKTPLNFLRAHYKLASLLRGRNRIWSSSMETQVASEIMRVAEPLFVMHESAIGYADCERDGGPRQHPESAMSCLRELAISGPGPPFALQHHLTSGIGFTPADGPAAHVITLFVRAAPSSPPTSVNCFKSTHTHTFRLIVFRERTSFQCSPGAEKMARSY